MRRNDGGRPANRARSVNTEHRLADGTESARQIQLRHHDALEHVGGLAEDHGVDVGVGQPGIVKCRLRRLTDETGH